jgi:hypothetical protein
LFGVHCVIRMSRMCREVHPVVLVCSKVQPWVISFVGGGQSRTCAPHPPPLFSQKGRVIQQFLRRNNFSCHLLCSPWAIAPAGPRCFLTQASAKLALAHSNLTVDHSPKQGPLRALFQLRADTKVSKHEQMQVSGGPACVVSDVVWTVEWIAF